MDYITSFSPLQVERKKNIGFDRKKQTSFVQKVNRKDFSENSPQYGKFLPRL